MGMNINRVASNKFWAGAQPLSTPVFEDALEAYHIGPRLYTPLDLIFFTVVDSSRMGAQIHE